MIITTDIDTKEGGHDQAQITVRGTTKEIFSALSNLSSVAETSSSSSREIIIREFLVEFSEPRYRSNKISTIKAVRAVTGLDLKEAKDFVEKIWG